MSKPIKPTDEDAKSRPTVEARNAVSVPWERGILVAVDRTSMPFHCWPEGMHYVKKYRYCRFPTDES
jgi:hypothetical protein